MKSFYTIILLVLSNSFMTLAWYGHLRFKTFKLTENRGLWAIIAISWGIAFFEYCLQVPANRIGYKGFGGPFTLVQLKVIQEAITLIVFVLFSKMAFTSEPVTTNQFIGFGFIILAVYFIFK